MSRAILSSPHFEDSSASVSMGNTLQDLPRLYETADNTERYIQGDQKVSVNLIFTV
jgi:hypothetical protein